MNPPRWDCRNQADKDRLVILLAGLAEQEQEELARKDVPRGITSDQLYIAEQEEKKFREELKRRSIISAARRIRYPAIILADVSEVLGQEVIAADSGHAHEINAEDYSEDSAKKVITVDLNAGLAGHIEYLAREMDTEELRRLALEIITEQGEQGRETGDPRPGDLTYSQRARCEFAIEDMERMRTILKATQYNRRNRSRSPTLTEIGAGLYNLNQETLINYKKNRHRLSRPR